MLTIQKNSRQIPKEKEICASKKYYDILYAYLQTHSEWDEKENIRRIDKKEINFSMLGDIFGLTRQTVSTKFKNLKELGLVKESADGKYYEIILLEEKTAALIPYNTLSVLINSLSERCISTYIYLLNHYYRNGCQPCQFNLEAIKAYVGLSTSTRSNNNILTDILYVLQKLELIKFKTYTNAELKTIYELEYLTNTLDKK